MVRNRIMAILVICCVVFFTACAATNHAADTQENLKADIVDARSKIVPQKTYSFSSDFNMGGQKHLVKVDYKADTFSVDNGNFVLKYSKLEAEIMKYLNGDFNKHSLGIGQNGLNYAQMLIASGHYLAPLQGARIIERLAYLNALGRAIDTYFTESMKIPEGVRKSPEFKSGLVKKINDKSTSPLDKLSNYLLDSQDTSASQYVKIVSPEDKLARFRRTLSSESFIAAQRVALSVVNYDLLNDNKISNTLDRVKAAYEGATLIYNAVIANEMWRIVGAK